MGTTGQSITLANSIIGVGILAMPFCYQQCGVVLATLILLFMGLVSRLCCHFLLKSALMARRRNFEFLGFHVFGLAGKMAVEVGIIGFLMGTCIAYFVVVGDLGPQIVAKMFNINQSDILRTSIMVIVSLVCVLPLGLLRNVDSLSSVSAVTIGFYFCLVMKVITEATSQLWAGEWHSKVAMWKPSGLLQCVPIFSMALFCQTQLFEIFESMPSLSLEKMNLVTKNAINICTGVYFTLGLFGYIAFSSQSISGNILMSLSPTMASDVIKLGFVMSVACSFPLIIFPCRASLYSFLYKKVHSSHHDHLIHNSIPEATFRCITVGIIAVALFVSLLIPNIELVLGLVGSTIGVLICVVFPAACFVNVTFKNTNERVLAKGVILLGLVIMVLGTYANLQAAENQVDRYDEKHITQERIDKMVEDFFESKRLEKNGFDSVSGRLVGNGHDEKKVIDNALNEVIKDSEVQPPNPEPPETQSDEKEHKKENIAEKNEDIPKQNTAQLNVVKDKNDSHPRNLKSKLNGETADIIEAPVINNQLEENVQKDNLEKEKKKQEEENIKHAEKIQEHIDMLKQKKLIETMKQHGEEQKELLEEQKVILHEIEKKKEEIEQSKKDADSNEAKKLAVESIQKIALKAIESLGGVSDKPIQNEAKNPEPIEAVQQIAIHAVDSIVAIQDAGKDKPSHGNEVVNAQKVVNIENNNEAPVQNSINMQNMQNSQINGQNSGNVVSQANNVNSNVVMGNNINDVPINNAQQTNNVGQNVQNPALVAAKVDAVLHQIKQNVNVKEQMKVEQKEHSHSPDEPQSYKQGEDLQKQQIKKEKPLSIQELVQNVPLPLALIANPIVANEKTPNQVNAGSISNTNMNINNNNINVPTQNKVSNNIDNNNINKVNLSKAEEKPVEIDIINENKAPNKPAEVNQNAAQDAALYRQKREVIDCTESTLLKPEDKRICETLLPTNPVKINQLNDLNGVDLLSSKVDLNDQLNRLPMDTNVIHRSLKSVDESSC